jgi:DNA helicase-2/ATP-dependent DNA helicase PcrA
MGGRGNWPVETLNPKQREAVLHTDGPLLILAGAGSGKTRVIVHRIAYLVNTCQVAPTAILAVTFTNKAAGEMKERVGRLLPGRHGVAIGTFHAICLRVLRAHIHHLGYKTDFTIYDASDSVALVKACMEALSVNTDLYPPKMLAGRISSLKNRLVSPDDYSPPSFGPDAALKKIYALYQERLRQLHGLDFDDLIGLTISLLSSQPTLLAHYHERFSHIMIDEYQDTNAAQYRLIQLLTSPARNLCVVGDDDQSIYAFRGADVGNILEFERDFPEAKVVVLDQNYRSTRSILTAAATVIGNNGRRRLKELWTDNHAGEPVSWEKVPDEREEGRRICRIIHDLKRTETRPLSDFCVLYRTNAQSRVLEEALRTAQIPYSIVGGLRFYDRKEIKDLLAYLRIIRRADDDLSLRRVINLPARGIGETTIERIEALATSRALSLWESIALLSAPGADASQIPSQARSGVRTFHDTIVALHGYLEHEKGLSELLRRLVELIAYADHLKKENIAETESRMENVMEFIAAAEQFEQRFRSETEGTCDLRQVLSAFIDQAALVSSSDDPAGQGITMMTLHAAKGLEFPVIFLVGMEEGLFPHSRALLDPKEMEEERRLCYVGMTRARERLFLMSADERKLYGALHYNPPSRFLKECNGSFAHRPDRPRTATIGLRAASPPAHSPRPTPVSSDEGIAEFPVGARVRHAHFGLGRVKEYEGAGEGLKVSVAFDIGTKKLAVRYAKLEAV